ncbi:MAG: hypothetical protein H6891_04375 [Brucellaceae bacterium]|nr:hypothetical protein [Brucellaceae bacterium]
MNNEPIRHHKVQFRRRDRYDLSEFPSAQAHEGEAGAKPARRRRPLLRIAGWLGLLVLLVVAAGYGALRFGLEGEQLDRRARDVVSAFAGPNLSADLNGARIVLDGSGNLAISTRDMRLFDAASLAEFARFDSIRLGLPALGVLRANTEVDRLTIEGGQLVMPGGGVSPAETGETRLIDPDAVLASVFNHLDRFAAAVEAPNLREVTVSDVAIVLDAVGIDTPLRIVEAHLLRKEGGDLGLTATLDDGRGTVQVNVDGHRPAGGDMQIDGTIDGVALDLTRDGRRLGIPIEDIWQIGGTLDLAFSARGTAGQRVLSGRARIPDLSVFLKERIDTRGSARVGFELAEGSGKLELSNSELALGRSYVRFSGAVGPDPDEDETGATGDAYRFEIVSNDMRLAPADSPEPAVAAGTKISGRFIPAERRLGLDQIALRTGVGLVSGEASMAFTGRYTPAAFLSLTVPRMPVSQAKQIWPPMAAPRTRAFVLDHVFGGMIEQGKLVLSVQADRIGAEVPLQPDELTITTRIDDSRFDLVGDLPPVRDASGRLDVAGISSTITLDTGTAFMASGRTATIEAATLVMENPRARPFYGDVTLQASGKADAVGELLSLDPIHALDEVPFGAADLSGTVTGKADIRFPIVFEGARPPVVYDMDMSFSGLAIAKPIDGQTVSGAAGTLTVDNEHIEIEATGALNGIPAKLAMVRPLNGSAVQPSRDVTLRVDDATRAKIAPGLNDILKGTVSMDLTDQGEQRDVITTDLTSAIIDLPFAGWTKSAGIPARAEFAMDRKGETIGIRDFKLSGKSFQVTGSMEIASGRIQSARFDKVQLNPGDAIAVDLKRKGKGYDVSITGGRFDGRSLVKRAWSDAEESVEKGIDTPVTVSANVREIFGFNKETLRNVIIDYAGRGARIDNLTFNAASGSGGGIVLTNERTAKGQDVKLESNDAGAILRFLDIYARMSGGRISANLKSTDSGALAGSVKASDFVVVNEPRLASLVSKPPQQGGKSLASTLDKDIDTTRVNFDEGTFRIEKGDDHLAIDEGILRGPLIGTTFSGMLYDKAGNMAINGTFMPAYGLNRLFGDIPLLGTILGNGSDKGLIGITYRLAGPAKNPTVSVNPVSVIAPGIFRKIFEYH